MISKAGFYDLTAAEYHSDPCEIPSLSSSIASEIVARSPAHAFLKHPRLNKELTGGGETAAMSFGSVVHELALGKGGGFEIWDGDSWRGNDAKIFRDLAILHGKTPIKRDDFERAENLVEEIRRQLLEMGLEYVLDEGKHEQVAVWQDNGAWCRAMFDIWIPERGEIWDIKTTGKSAHPEQVSRTIPAMNYDLRSEFYLFGAEKITGIPVRRGGLGYQFLFAETERPFLITPGYMPENLKARGRKRAREAIDTWARCMETNKWPGYVNGIVEFEAPGWVDFEIEETGITASGDRIV